MKQVVRGAVNTPDLGKIPEIVVSIFCPLRKAVPQGAPLFDATGNAK